MITGSYIDVTYEHDSSPVARCLGKAIRNCTVPRVSGNPIDLPAKDHLIWKMVVPTQQCAKEGATRQSNGTWFLGEAALAKRSAYQNRAIEEEAYFRQLGTQSDRKLVKTVGTVIG